MQRNRSSLSGFLALLALVPAVSLFADPAAAHPVNPPRAPLSVHAGHDISPEQLEQDSARHARQAGNVFSLHIIMQRVLPTMPGMQFLGLEYDGEAMAYRLKFIRDGRVVFVDVDARTGQVLNRTP